ncbi:MAG: hypothetical protein ABJB40_07520 [Acidobacteriota bacterium]
MKKLINSFVVITLLAIACVAQGSADSKKDTSKSSAAVTISPVDMAKATLAAHGGDKLKNIKSLVMKGSVDLNVSNQSLPGAFSSAISGEKYYFEINSVVQSMKQVYDGRQVYSSLPGFSLPPVTSLGFPLLIKVGEAGYPITALPDDKKKKKGFRITTPDGFYTDFLTDEKTGQIKGYESSYEVSGRNVTTSVEVDQFETVQGILIPKKYSQRFDLGQLTAYANFNIKTILVNSTIDDDAFAIPH